MSPYAGSMYHGSPLLLSLLGPLTTKRYVRIHRIICKKGIAAAHSMTLKELAEELRGYGSIWSNLADSNEKGGMKSDCVMSHVHVELEKVAATDPFAFGF